MRLAAGVGLWFLAVALVFAAGWLLTKRGNFTKTLRALGFAQSIYSLVDLCPLSPDWRRSSRRRSLPWGSWPSGWAPRLHTRPTGWRTLLLPVVVVLVSVIGTAIIAILLAGAQFTLQALLADLGIQQ